MNTAMFERTLNRVYGDFSSADPVEICRKFEIGVRYVSDWKCSAGALLVELRDRNFHEILLPSHCQDKPTDWDRFLIAHELAHYFLNRYHGYLARPLDGKEYLVLEKVCDAFATRLTGVVPPEIVAEGVA